MSNRSKDGDFNLDEELRSKIVADEDGEPIQDDHEDEKEFEDPYDHHFESPVSSSFITLKDAKKDLKNKIKNLKNKCKEEIKELDKNTSEYNNAVQSIKEKYSKEIEKTNNESIYQQKLKAVAAARENLEKTLDLLLKNKNEALEKLDKNDADAKKELLSQYKIDVNNAKKEYKEIRHKEIYGDGIPKTFEEIYRINPKIKKRKELIDSDVLLSVRNLKQFFFFGSGPSRTKLKAVSNISFDVHEGECFGIVGESGCGKTTTGRSIIKLYDITSGSVYYKGYRISAGNRWNRKEIKFTKIRLKKQINDLKTERSLKIAELDKKSAKYNEKVNAINETYALKIQEAKEKANSICETQKAKIKQIKFDNAHTPRKLVNEIQMIFQDPVDSLDPRMTVEDIIQEGLKIQGFNDKEENHKKVVEMLEKVGLVPDHASRYPHEFSGGQRQRIGIARALVMNPKLLICDEPISALDVSIRAQIINLLNDLKEELGLTIIFIAHDLSVVKYFCDRIAVMHFGKIVELADSDELFRNPLHPYTKSLLSAIPKPNPRTEKTRVRMVYNPATSHDYSVEKPELKEIKPGHLIYCNNPEFEEYKKILK